MQNFDNKLNALIFNALQEDIATGDVSALSCIPAEQQGKAVLKIKQDGVLAGVDIAQKIFQQVDPNCTFTLFKADGDRMTIGEKAFEVTAPTQVILKCERLVLNTMQRMSGIATLTRKYVDKIAKYRTQILDTRKTTPNFRLLEKEAVRIGGGVNHRFGLYDMIMLKDNHIDYCGGVKNAIEKAWQYVQNHNSALKIEIEARNLSDIQNIVKFGNGKVFRIMLDNFTPTQIIEALPYIDSTLFETEASGGINLETIESYAATGVDFVSVGGLIHQAQSLDLSLKAIS